ncbi:MAG: argininosuccinate lyase [Sphaerochaeta sp.]|uniref:argininosuccinate lyase n=1 Tax=Sphaerochaeta sp. TaxID=1972642 RepID=UPI003D14A646
MNLPRTFEEVKNSVLREEGETYPGKSLVDMELRPGYDRAKNSMIAHMLAINEAHLLMLIKQEIITKEQGRVILHGLETIDYDVYKRSNYSGEYEDLFFAIESELIRRTNGLGGNLHLGRSRNDMCLCLSRMVIREDMLDLLKELIKVLNTVLRFAQAYKDCIYVVHTHTQHAQPSVLGHYFLGVFEMLVRDVKRLKSAYNQINESPMGAAAITTSGFPLDRKFVSDLIGCDNFIYNAYDAIGNVDFFTETSAAISLAALNLGRVVTDMTLWATEELHMIRVSDGYISTSSIMPQKRNPIALEHLRSNLSLTKGLADSIQLGFLKSPYGDISDYEDAEEPMAQSMKQLRMNYHLFSAVLATLEVDASTLSTRAYESFSVVTEMADELYRRYRIPFRKAHHIVASLVKEAETKKINLKQIDEKLFSSVYERTMGLSFTGDFSSIRESLDPKRFIEKRGVEGGTSSMAMNSMIEKNENSLLEIQKWYDDLTSRLLQANMNRKELVREILAT